MVMRPRVIVRMTMMRVVAMRVAMLPVTMIGRRCLRIGTALGLERRLDRSDCGPQSPQQALDRGVAPHPQPACTEFGRHVAVAEMEGDARQRRAIGGPDFQQRFGFGDNLDQRAVVEEEAIVGAQARARQPRLDLRSAQAVEHGIGPLALFEVEQQRIAHAPAARRTGTDRRGGAEGAAVWIQFSRSGRSASPGARLGGVTTSPRSPSAGLSTLACKAASRRTKFW